MDAKLDATTLEIQSLFYQSAFQACIDAVRQNTSGSPSDPAVETRLLYGARASIALGQFAAAQALLPSDSIHSHAAQAVRTLAAFLKAKEAGDGNADDYLARLHELLDEAVFGDVMGQTIRVCAATAMAHDDDPVGALEVLNMGTASSKELECVALGVHILLSINRLDVAQKEYNAARKWADDSLLVQLIEAMIGIYEGGRAATQAYYVYDELAQNPAHAGKPSTVPSLTGKSVARLVSADYADADATLAQAVELNAQDGNALANRVPLALLGRPTGQEQALQAAMSQLRSAAPQHALLRDLSEKEQAFDEALARHQETINAA